MQGIYTYIHETKYVPRENSVVAILLLLFMVLISLLSMLNYYYYYYYYDYYVSLYFTLLKNQTHCFHRATKFIKLV